MKTKISFVCQECGYDSVQWMGKCPECGAWNSMREIKEVGLTSVSLSGIKPLNVEPKKIADVVYEERQRLLTGFSEANGVLGGGIVKGSVVLLAGDPGIGKSTLLLQIALNIAQKQPHIAPRCVLYISGEESEEQIKLRAQRLHKDFKNSNLLLLSLTNTDQAIETIQKIKPSLVIVDSIQTMESENVSGMSGSIPQIRYSASQFIKAAKILRIPVIMVGHVTKEGMVAGPMVLSHMVDAVLFLEGEKYTRNRILRGLKNRFGPIDEVGVFSMDESGMKEINNPEQLFLTKNKDKNVAGSVVTVTAEGTRSFLVEVQALVISSHLPMPRRIASGIDYKRLELLLAVLQKHCNMPLSSMDVFVNVVGGIKLSDPGADLGICLAIFSSTKNIPLSGIVGIAEVGLLGELRSVAAIEKRVKEAKKLGFKNVVTANTHKTLNGLIRELTR